MKTRRDELLSVALEVLERDGFHSLSIGAIARRAGIKPPSLYKQFASKADLELRLIGRGLSMQSAAFSAAVAAAGPAASRRDLITLFATTYREFGLRNRQLYQLMNSRPYPFERLGPGVEETTLKDYLTLFRNRVEARSAWAWAHGILSLELVGSFDPSADLNVSWRLLIDTITGWGEPIPSAG